MSERDLLQAQTAEETIRRDEALMHLRREYLEDVVAHVLAILLALGFFLLALFVLLGKVKIEEAAVATMVGTIVGIAASKLDPILFRYFKATPTPPPPKAKELPPTSAEPPPAEKGSSNAIQP